MIKSRSLFWQKNFIIDVWQDGTCASEGVRKIAPVKKAPQKIVPEKLPLGR